MNIVQHLLQSSAELLLNLDAYQEKESWVYTKRRGYENN